MRQISSATLRLFVVFVALSLAVVGPEPLIHSGAGGVSTPPSTIAQPVAPAPQLEVTTVPVCTFTIQGFTRDRYVEGAPLDAECPAFLNVGHTAPFGNWGVTSNLGSRYDANQFAGWCPDSNRWLIEESYCRPGDFDRDNISGEKWQWNSCKRSFPSTPGNSHFYNAARPGQSWNSEQRGIDTVEWYGTLHIARVVEGPRACEVHDGTTLTVENNDLRLYELDWTGDAYVGILQFPDISVPLSCNTGGCNYVESAVVAPFGRDGRNDDPNARIHLSVSASFALVETVTGYLDDDSSPQAFVPDPALSGTSPASFLSLLPGASSLRRGSPNLSPTAPVGDLELQVKRRDTKAPVENATVVFVEDDDDNNIRVRSLRLGAEGRGGLSTRGFERKEVMVFADGFGGVRKTVFPTSGKSKVAVELEQGGAVTGVVLSPRATPISGAEVRVVYASEIRRRSGVRSHIQADFHRGIPLTGSDGVFAMLDVRPGVYFKLEVSHLEGNATLGPFNLRPGQKIENLQVVLR